MGLGFPCEITPMWAKKRLCRSRSLSNRLEMPSGKDISVVCMYIQQDKKNIFFFRPAFQHLDDTWSSPPPKLEAPEISPDEVDVSETVDNDNDAVDETFLERLMACMCMCLPLSY